MNKRTGITSSFILHPSSFLLRADRVVRGELRIVEEVAVRQTLAQLFWLIAAFGCLYGAAMGTYGGIGDERILQVFYSAFKVPLLLLVTFALSLPSFFVFNTLYGLGGDWPHAVRALMAGQAGVTILLASLAPLTLLWNVSTNSHNNTVLFNAAMFGVATWGGQILLRRYYRVLLARDVRHRQMLRLWGVLYTFVGIQMGWILRPFIGDLNKPTAFFREDTWGNAYIIVFDMIRRMVMK